MNAFVIRSSDIERCPVHSLLPGHYNEDRSCREHVGDRGICRHCGEHIAHVVLRGETCWVHVEDRRAGRVHPGVHCMIPVSVTRVPLIPAPVAEPK